MPEDFGEYDEKIGIDFQPKFIQKIVKIGEVRSLEMNLYEVNHRSENDPRISLSRDSFRLLAHYGIKRALILFISQNSLNYRLSLVTIDLKWEEGKRVQKEYSNPRRYSFFLGPETKTHTPETYLIKKGRVKDFDDLKERFSLEIVNKDFYTQIAILFTKLAGGERTIGRTQFDEKGSLYLPSTTDDKIKKEFSVRLIGRLVFCWFLKKKCSDKGTPLLPEELLSSKAVIRKSDFYHNILEPLFFETLNTPIKERKKEYQLPPWSQIPFLNGGLFMPEYHDYYQIDQLGISKYINTLKVPDSWLKELFEIFEIYNFTIDENTSVDVELSIEPEMLGRIFENLLAEINPETGNTARKATGSYYTPRPIVEYMVDESLKQYLLTKTNLDEKKISSLLAYEEEEVGLSESKKDAILDALDVIKIIDPACGSGAFPMGILQKMLLILQKIDPESKKWLNKKVSKIENTIVREEFQKKIEAENWNYVHKLGIIQNSIYGVDIQPIAVDISKLRFFLSLIVDEKVDDSKENRGIDSLPNLEFKFVCANSLIGLPKKNSQTELFEVADNIRGLKRLREEYLRCYGDEKTSIEKKFQEIQSEMFLSSLKWLNWGGGDSQTVKLSQWNPFSGESCEWFDPDWMFGVKEGFDIVIANPPYVQIKQIPWANRKIFEDKFVSAVGRFNLFYFFIELSNKLARISGISAFIVPDRLLLNTQCDRLRRWLLTGQTIIEIDSFAEGVFEAIIDSIIIIYTNTKNCNKEILAKNKVPLENLKRAVSNTIPISYFLNSPNSQFDLSYSPIKADLLTKMKLLTIPLGDIGDVKDGIIQGKVADKLFLKKPVDTQSQPLLFGEDINRFNISFNDNWVNYKPSQMMAIEVKRRGEGVRHGLWMRNPAIFERKKILTRQTADEIIAAYDLDNYYYSNTLHGTAITNQQYNPLYVLSLLNSRLMTWYYRNTTAEEGKVFAQVKIELLKLLPVRIADEKTQQPFITLVDKILTITKTPDYLQNMDKQAQVKEYENKIDQIVYKLYDLTDDEIKIVENFHKKV